MFFWRKAPPYTKSSVYDYIQKTQFFFHHSILLVPKSNLNVLAKLNQATVWHGLWRGVHCGCFLYKPFLVKEHCIVLLALISIICKVSVMSFKTTLGFILITRPTSTWGEHIYINPKIFLQQLEANSVMPNCLNSFLMDCTIDLGIADWFEIGLYTVARLVEVNNSVSSQH